MLPLQQSSISRNEDDKWFLFLVRGGVCQPTHMRPLGNRMYLKKNLRYEKSYACRLVKLKKWIFSPLCIQQYFTGLLSWYIFEWHIHINWLIATYPKMDSKRDYHTTKQALSHCLCTNTGRGAEDRQDLRFCDLPIFRVRSEFVGQHHDCSDDPNILSTAPRVHSQRHTSAHKHSSASSGGDWPTRRHLEMIESLQSTPLSFPSQD